MQSKLKQSTWVVLRNTYTHTPKKAIPGTLFTGVGGGPTVVVVGGKAEPLGRAYIELLGGD